MKPTRILVFLALAWLPCFGEEHSDGNVASAPAEEKQCECLCTTEEEPVVNLYFSSEGCKAADGADQNYYFQKPKGRTCGTISLQRGVCSGYDRTNQCRTALNGFVNICIESR